MTTEVKECQPGDNELMDELTAVLNRLRPGHEEAVAALMGIAVQGIAVISATQQVYDCNVLSLIRGLIQGCPTVWNMEVAHRQRAAAEKGGRKEPLQ